MIHKNHCLFPNQESKLDVIVSSTICPILLIEPPMIESLRKGTKMQVPPLSGLISSLRMADFKESNKVDTKSYKFNLNQAKAHKKQN